MSGGDGIEGRVLSTFNDYAGFLHAMRARAAERQIAISSDEAHNVAGLSDRRITQMLSLRTLRNIQSVRRVGILSLGPLLGVLGVKLVMVEDAEAVERFGSRLKKRNNNLVHSGTVHITMSTRYLRKIQKKGGKNSRKNMSKAKARRLGRRAALIRWADVKEASSVRRPKLDRRAIARGDNETESRR
jgi:hypothetical protein